MTRNVILIIGDPTDEKTSLSRRLEARGWAALHVDALYVAFIQSRLPELFFPRLHDFVAPHYTHIFAKVAGNDRQSGRRDVVSAWHSLLLEAILSASSSTPLLAVEGIAASRLPG